MPRPSYNLGFAGNQGLGGRGVWFPPRAAGDPLLRGGMGHPWDPLSPGLPLGLGWGGLRLGQCSRALLAPRGEAGGVTYGWWCLKWVFTGLSLL